jgi:hypothetical protein
LAQSLVNVKQIININTRGNIKRGTIEAQGLKIKSYSVKKNLTDVGTKYKTHTTNYLQN